MSIIGEKNGNFTNISVSESTYLNTTQDNSLTQMLARDPTDNKIKWVDKSTIGSALTESTTGYTLYTMQQSGFTIGNIDINLAKVGTNIVVITNRQSISATPNLGGASLVSSTNIPAAYRPSSDVFGACWVVSQNRQEPGSVKISTTGQITIGRGPNIANFQNNKINGVYEFSFAYII